jgi:hypothetical protein
MGYVYLILQTDSNYLSFKIGITKINQKLGKTVTNWKPK